MCRECGWSVRRTHLSGEVEHALAFFTRVDHHSQDVQQRCMVGCVANGDDRGIGRGVLCWLHVVPGVAQGSQTSVLRNCTTILGHVTAVWSEGPQTSTC